MVAIAVTMIMDRGSTDTMRMGNTPRAHTQIMIMKHIMIKNTAVIITLIMVALMIIMNIVTVTTIMTTTAISLQPKLPSQITAVSAMIVP